MSVSNSLIKKERCEWFASDWSELLAKNKTSYSLEKLVIFDSFWQFFPFVCPRVNCSRRSLLIRSFIQSDLSDLLLSLLTKERLWAIRSRRSFAHKNKRYAQKTNEPIPNPACYYFFKFLIHKWFSFKCIMGYYFTALPGFVYNVWKAQSINVLWGTL